MSNIERAGLPKPVKELFSPLGMTRLASGDPETEYLDAYAAAYDAVVGPHDDEDVNPSAHQRKLKVGTTTFDFARFPGGYEDGDVETAFEIPTERGTHSPDRTVTMRGLARVRGFGGKMKCYLELSGKSVDGENRSHMSYGLVLPNNAELRALGLTSNETRVGVPDDRRLVSDEEQATLAQAFMAGTKALDRLVQM